jgi:hypothetical protein
MPEYTISNKDLRDAESFLVEFQTEVIPEANLEVGGAVRDLLIKGFAYVYAYLRGEIDRVTARQSLLKIQDGLEEGDDIAQAVDELLSNWFIIRKGGTKSLMTGRLHFTEKRAQAIPSSSKFWRNNTIVFVIDSDIDPYMIAEDQMFPVFDSSGELIDYVVDVPLVAFQTGEVSDIEPGKFVKVQVPGGLPYFSYAENTEKSSGGKDYESSDEMIERAETAISVRNLINNRSCDVTLQELFPAISETLTIGMGEDEQIRDRRTEVARHIVLYVGGAYDTYISLPLVTVEENLTVGGYFVRPDNVVAVFRDPELTYDQGQTFLTELGVEAGNVIYIREGITGSPRGYQITNVTDHELEVSVNTPFTEASDELATNEVSYSIGWLSPGFEEIEFTPGVFVRIALPSINDDYSSVPFGTSRRAQSPGKAILSGKPVQDVTWVEITDPPSALAYLIDPSTETIIFQNRVNNTPEIPAEPAYTQYQIDVPNSGMSQSMQAVNRVNLGGVQTPPGSIFDGYNLRVVYQTLNTFASVHDYVMSKNTRVACANQLVRARHPVWIEVSVPYRMKATTTDELDEEDASQQLAAHINSFDPDDTLDVSDLSAFLRTTYSSVGAIYPLEVFYHLDSPDGQQVYFSTTDLISIFDTGSNGVTLENSDELTPPDELISRGITKINSAESLLDWFTYVGISDRTVSYRSTEYMISFVLRS